MDDGWGDCGPEWYREWVAGWRRAQQRRGRAPGSLRVWGVYLRDFGAMLEDEAVTGPELLTREIVQRWQDQLRPRMKPATQRVAVTAVRGLLKWADREEVSARSGLWSWLDTPHVPQGLPRALEPSALDAVMRAYASPRRDLVHMRDRALFWFLVTTGSRITAALRVDRDQAQSSIIVRQKGGDEHRLVMSDRARQWVLEYLRLRGDDKEPALWIHVGPRSRRRLRADQANEIWSALAAKLGIPVFTSHQLKHTGVTELGERESSDDLVAKHIGWKSSAMMSRYRKLRDARRQELVDRLDDLVPEPAAPPPSRRRRRYRIVRRDRPA